MYLAWFDNDRKKPVTTKVTEAAARYRQKFHEEPAECICNPRDVDDASPVPMRAWSAIAPNSFWIGKPE